ncbi:AcrR family transcriptional regulator [Paraburkholderia sp. WSM4175]
MAGPYFNMYSIVKMTLLSKCSVSLRIGERSDEWFAETMKSSGEKTGMAPAQLARRAEIGRERRARTRALLMDAGIRVLAEKGPDNASIDDFMAKAGLAKGTFYNHFQTREDMLTAVATDLAEELNLHIVELTAAMPDPAQRMACAVRYFVQRAADDAIWGWVVLRIGLGAGPLGDSMARELTRDVRDGVKSKRFLIDAEQVGADVMLGSGLMGIRSVLLGKAGPKHASAVAASILRALGVPASEAAKIAAMKLPALDPSKLRRLS